MLRFSSIAPFDTPVVPPVYCRNAMSSGLISTRASVMPAAARSTWLKRSALSNWYAGTIFFTLRTTKLTSAPLAAPSRSPIAATTTCFTGVLAITCSSVCAKFSRITIALAPESLSWCSSSRGVYSGLTFTTTRPARRTPNSATGYCSTLGIISATRSPFCRPCACSHAPNACDIRSSSPKLISLPMQ